MPIRVLDGTSLNGKRRIERDTCHEKEFDRQTRVWAGSTLVVKQGESSNFHVD